MNFLSDNASGAHPSVLEAIAAANMVDNHGYGDEERSTALKKALSELFETEVWVYPVVTGTAANALILATLCPPHGAILCQSDAHIETDECGAPEFFSAGAKLRTVASDAGKLSPDAVEEALSHFHPMVHMVQPHVLSLTQSTEAGRVYSVEDVRALTEVGRAHGLSCHMDGARFANAVAALGCAPADITWRAGVDALSFGATKNGTIAAEAVIFFREDLVKDFEYRRKRSGHLLSKQHFVSAQLLAYVQDGLWLKLAAHANAMASDIADSAGDRLHVPCDANEVFITLSDLEKEKLREEGFGFYDWGPTGSSLARFVTSWTSKTEEVTALAHALKAL